MNPNKQVSIREDPNSNAWILHVEKEFTKPNVVITNKLSKNNNKLSKNDNLSKVVKYNQEINYEL